MITTNDSTNDLNSEHACFREATPSPSRLMSTIVELACGGVAGAVGKQGQTEALTLWLPNETVSTVDNPLDIIARKNHHNDNHVDLSNTPFSFCQLGW